MVKRTIKFVAAGLAICAIGVLIGLSLFPPTAPAAPAQNLTSNQLQDEKLRQEILDLQIRNDQNTSPQRSLLAWAPFVTALGAIAAVSVTLWKQSTDLRTAHKQLEEDRARARTAAEEESHRRFDTSLTSIITNLGSKSEILKVNAAAALSTFLVARYEEFHDVILVVLTANLRQRPTEAVARVLGTDLEKLLRLRFSGTLVREDRSEETLDLARAHLHRFNASNIDFGGTEVDAAFADLTEARLNNAKLRRLKGMEVILEHASCSGADLGEARLNKARISDANMHKVNLVSATLKNADLQGTEFFNAKLQEAHFEGANLQGAEFTGANVANTYFQKAIFDDAALRSIALGAKRWRDNKNFDPDVRKKLEAFGSQSEEKL